jgi:hypothetical protein
MKFKTSGTIINSQEEPIIGCIITSSNGYSTVTDKEGKFILKGEYEKGFPFTIEISNPLYSSISKIPFTLNGDIIENVGIIKLIQQDKTLKDSTISNSLISSQHLELLKSSKSNFETLQMNTLIGVGEKIKYDILPRLIEEIVKFGITLTPKINPNNILDQKIFCPSDINIIISNKNKLVKRINIIYQTLNRVKIVVSTTDKIITASQIAIEILKLTPTPAPPGVSSSLIEIENKLRKYKIISSVTLIILTIIIDLLRQLIDMLNMLDKLVAHCIPDNTNNMELLSQELLALTQQQSQIQPVITNVNGFEMGVESEPNTINQIKRKRAIAKNKKGIIMLKGEWSYSSIEQILIDELVFYIQQNDLKAD